MQRRFWQGLAAAVSLASLGVLAGCGSSGSETNDYSTLSAEDTSSIAGPVPGDAATLQNPGFWNGALNVGVQEAESMQRETFGTQLALTGPGRLSYTLTSSELSAASDGLNVFIDPRLSNTSGVGPYFNQRNCLGCHQSQLAAPPPDFAVAYASFPPRIPTVVSRARTEDAFLLFGDYNPGSGDFNPRRDAGGIVLHRQQLPGFPPQQLPPTLGGPYIRVTGMRAGPPYIARGLLEAVPDDEILLRADPYGTGLNGPGITGSGNYNSEATAGFIGASPTIRLSRFGVRGAGPSLLQFDIGGLNGEIGLTTPFTPNANEPSPIPDPVPSPAVSFQQVDDLRTLIRMIAPPVRHLNVGPYTGSNPSPAFPNGELPQQPPSHDYTTDPNVIQNAAVQSLLNSENRGRVLFGADYTLPLGFNSPPAGTNSAAGLYNAANLNCAGCHTPVMITGQSPAQLGGEHLTNKRFYPFSDLLPHHMGTFDNDYVLEASVTGTDGPDQFRTPPLMGIGLTGPPFWHDGRFQATLGIDEALREAIEAHDSPGSEAQFAGQAFKMLEANPVTVNGVTYTYKDLIHFVEGL